MANEIAFEYDSSKYIRVFTTKDNNPGLNKTFLILNENWEKVRELEKEYSGLENVSLEETVEGHPFKMAEPIFLEKTKRQHPCAKPELDKKFDIPVSDVFYNFLTPMA